MSSWRKIASVVLLALMVLFVLALTPGHRSPSAEARDAGALEHPHIVLATRRRAAGHSSRAILGELLSRAPSRSRWLSSWAAPPEDPTSRNSVSEHGLDNQTIRQIVLASSSGAAVRIHLTNADGDRPIVIGAATVAAAGSSGTLTGAPHPITFNGRSWVTVGPGTAIVSDPVAMNVRPLERLAVSLYMPRETGALTMHGAAEQTGFIGGGDDVANTTSDWIGATVTSWYLLSGIDTLSPPRYAGTIVAFGDSITAGFRSTLDTFGAWPEDLARRLARLPGRTLAVADAGISGNRVLHSDRCCGPAGVLRFTPDALTQAGVREVILLEGINDIGFSQETSPLSAPHTDVSAAQIIAGYRRMAAAAHAAGLRIYAGTLLPFKGAAYWTPAGELKRDAINRWLLTTHSFDGVINFAAVMADPGHPQILNPVYDSGDHLHPNNAGYAVMARALSLATLVRAAFPAASVRLRPHRLPGSLAAEASGRKRSANAT